MFPRVSSERYVINTIYNSVIKPITLLLSCAVRYLGNPQQQAGVNIQ